MKPNIARETFEQIRSRKKNLFALHIKLTLWVTVETVICIVIAFGLDALFKIIFSSVSIPLWIELISIALVLGSFVTARLTKHFFDPFKTLRTAIEKVADGDFTVQIETKSTSKEVQEIFSGFNLMVHELSATEILQSNFVTNVSHEFKTPINAIEGYSMLLQNGENLTEEQKLYVDKIVFNTSRLSSLVGSILLLSKLENQSIMTKETTFSLDEQIRHAILALETAWDSKQIEFDVFMDSVNYTGQETLLHHVWINLISNAIKFSPKQGVVTIILKNCENGILFTISDQGKGLSDDDKHHVFDKFYQGDTSHKDDGNGLGLALVKRIVTLSHGSIQADNNEDGGAIFTVTLPAPSQ